MEKIEVAITRFVQNRVQTGLSESKNIKGDSEAIQEYALDIIEAIREATRDDYGMDIAEAIAEKLTKS